jgi:uncharacterized membrane protein
MYRILFRTIPLLALLWTGTARAAVDSYHYLHVTIETPWFIFLVLAPMVLAPMVIMAFMAWRHAERRKEDEEAGDVADAAEGKKE